MIKTLIVGLGNIGFKFDQNDILKKITHSSAIYNHKKFLLVGGVEQKKNISLRFRRIYNVPVFKNLKNSLKYTKPELIIFTNQPGLKDINYLSKIKNIKFLLIEKPFFKKKNEIRKILRILKQNQISITLNFQRNFSKKYIKLGNQIMLGIIGKTFKTFCFYNKSFIDNGSHFLNFINIYSKNFKKVLKNSDNLQFKYKNGDAFFYKIANTNYNNNNIIIFGDKGKIEISSRPEKCTIFVKERDPFYKNLFILKKFKSINLFENEPQKPVLDNIYEVIKFNKKNLFNETKILKYLSIMEKTK